MPQMDGKQVKNTSIDGLTKLVAASVDTPQLTPDAADATIVDLADTYDYAAGGGILRVATPVAAGDAAPKSYVDGVASGLDWKESVRAATVAAGALATDFENLDVIDGVTLATGNRILIKNQAAGVENGIYTVNASGAPTRAADFLSGDTVASSAVFVEEGTANGDTGHTCTNDQGTDVVGTDALVFVQFTGIAALVAGVGLTKTGSTIDVGDVNKGVQGNVDDLQVDASEIAGDGLAQAAGGGNEHILDWDPSSTGGLQIVGAQAAILAADTSVSTSGSGLTAAVPSAANKNLTASVTTTDNDQATASTLVGTVAKGSYPKVEVNGVGILVGDGTKVSVEAYFSGDGGTTARAFSAIVAGDTLHWNGSIAGYQLAATDVIDIFLNN